jgi:FkbM family methyltransferase
MPLFPRKRSHLQVLHVGAHEGEEAKVYGELGLGRVTWVEANPSLAEKLGRSEIGERDRVYCGAAWSTTGLKMQLLVTNNVQSSSLLKLGKHKEYYPHILIDDKIKVETTRLDDLVPPTKFFVANFDIQGAELHALEGMGSLLDSIRVMYLEVNREELYENCPLVSEIDFWMKSRGFRRVMTSWTPEGWGDAVYTRLVPWHRVLKARWKFATANLGLSYLLKKLSDSIYRKFIRIFVA